RVVHKAGGPNRLSCHPGFRLCAKRRCNRRCADRPSLRRFAREGERRKIARPDNTNRSLPFHFAQWYRHRAGCEGARELPRLKYELQVPGRGTVGGKLFLWAVRVEARPAELRL